MAIPASSLVPAEVAALLDRLRQPQCGCRELKFASLYNMVIRQVAQRHCEDYQQALTPIQWRPTDWKHGALTLEIPPPAFSAR